MRVVLPVRGSTGDLRPSLAVGLAMRQRGHEVIVVSHLVYQSVVEQAGLDFRALDDSAEAQAFESAASLLQEARGGAEFWRNHVIPGLLRETRILLDLCRERASLLLLQPVYDMAGRFAAELIDLPTRWLFISPAMVSGMAMRVGLVEELAPQLNQVRDALELPPLHDVSTWLSYAPENPALWPDWFAPDLQRPDITPVGFPPVQASSAEPGSRVLISGSTGRFLPGSLFEVAVAACSRLQLPALVMSPFPDLIPGDLPPDIEVTGFQPHQQVMPQASAVIHHGGIGTTISALAHGRPQLVLAAGADRPDNGLRIQSLELGRCLLTARWTPSEVAAALHDILTSPIIRERTTYYRQRLLTGGNPKLMTDLLERAAQTPWKPTPPPAKTGLAALSPERRKLAEKLLRQRRQQAQAAEPEGPRPAAPAQQRIWLAQQLDPDSSAFHKVHGLRLSGPLERPRLEQALQRLVERHQVLRTNLRWVENDLLEVPGGGSEAWSYTDLSELDPTLHWEQIQRFGLDLVDRAYDLAAGPLLRPHLVRLGEQEHFLLIGLHAAVSDAASTEVLWRHLGQAYETPEATQESVSFGRYARTLQASLPLEQLVAWWRAQLAGLVEVEPPLAGPRPERLSNAGAGYLLTLPRATLSSLEHLARARGVTLFVLLLAAFQALLQRYTRGLDVVVGTRAAGRTHPDTLPLIGPLANTLVLRTRADGDPTFLEWLERVAAMWRDTQAHQNLPFQTLVEALQPPRRANRHPFFSVLFYLQGQPLENLPWGDLEARQVLLKRGTTSDDLALSCRVVADQLRCLFEYRTDLYPTETIHTLGQDWTQLLEAICQQPETRLSQLPPHHHRQHPVPSAQAEAPVLNGPPQGALEGQLADLFARHLGLTEVQRYDNFFRLGGHSMLGARLLIDLEHQAGRKLTLTTLFESPTVAELARILNQKRGPEALIQLQKGTGKVELVLVHPASGSLSIYQRLLDHLGPEPNVYGLQALWQGDVPEHRTLQAMADHYAEQVRKLPGPCVLAGLSLGARIALQVAHRLPPEQVRRVVLLDGWGPGYPRFPNLLVRLKIHLVRALRQPPGQRLDYLKLRVRALGELLQRRLRGLLHRLRPSTDFAGYFSPGVTQVAPIRYEGSVLLVRAREQPVACFPDPRLGWTEQLLPHLEMTEVPGYHGFMMHDPNVVEVARILKDQL
ncbi:hypothetical protein ABS71_02430 [bacterium SCN 62-11]|nr:MAG: hypothetical protein ABS71_02430 [bacterium SCN 62-11]